MNILQKVFLLSASVLFLPTTAARAESVCSIVLYQRATMAFVAKPGRLGEMNALIRAGEKSALVEVLACLPSIGTKVIITDHGFASHTIRVLDGQFKGCVGNVASEFVGQCK